MEYIISITTIPTDGSYEITLSCGAKLILLPQDYANLPFIPETGAELSQCREVQPPPDAPMNEYYDGGKLQFLRLLANRRKIYSSALSKLAAADLSAKRLERKLYDAFSPKADAAGMDRQTLKILCESAASEFAEKGYINDRAYAEKKASQLREQRFFGKSKIKNELYRHGISAEIISEILSAPQYDQNSPENLDCMLKLLHKKYRGAPLSDKSERAKATAFLSRAGFRLNEAASAVAVYG